MELSYSPCTRPSVMKEAPPEQELLDFQKNLTQYLQLGARDQSMFECCYGSCSEDYDDAPFLATCRSEISKAI